jgi:Nuclease-related domain
MMFRFHSTPSQAAAIISTGIARARAKPKYLGRLAAIVSGVDGHQASDDERIRLRNAGVPGASARRELERRQTRREQATRTKHPVIGGLTLALSDDPPSTKSWATGALGEERLGQRLNKSASDTLRVLHDRRIPGSTANIDHLAVTPTGVYVIDAKKYRGRPQLKVEGGLLRPRVVKLLVGTRDRTTLVDKVLKQVVTVEEVVGVGVPVHGALCFVEADWPLIGGSFTIRGVEALWPKKLISKLRADGPLDTESITDVHRRIASYLPPA